MSIFSWKVAVSILGLRLISMKLMPQVYDRNAGVKDCWMGGGESVRGKH